MTAKIIDGTSLAKRIREGIKKKVMKLSFTPGIAFVLVGNNPASQIYVEHKQKACKEVGFFSKKIRLDENIDELELLKAVDELNQENKIHGIIVQLPLPRQINSQFIIDSILPHKDADGINPINIGNMVIGNNLIIPATPKGVIKLIESTGITIEGKHAVVLGRSNIVGKPLSILLLQKNATVSICHSYTKNLEELTNKADILVSAMGKPRFVTSEMVKSGAVVIDVGITRVGTKLIGDVDFEGVKKVASYITPVPGGVGPMTIAMLLENTLECIGLKR